MQSNQTTAGLILQSHLFEHGWLAHGFGTRGINVVKYCDALGIKEPFVAETDQVHSDIVHNLMKTTTSGKLLGDSFITNKPGIVCFIRTADCVPILIADTKNNAIAAVHAGWKGTTKNIVSKTLRAMNVAFATNPVNCVAAIGPHICGRCYEVGREVQEAFEGLYLNEAWVSKKNVDLGLANLILLKRAGIPDHQIDISKECTSCDKKFASVRRDGAENERQMNFIAIL